MDEQQNIIIYRTADGKASVALYAKDGKIWLNQQQMAELFATSKQTISHHIINILKEKELNEISVVKEYLTTAADGKNYNVVFYSLHFLLFLAKYLESNFFFRNFALGSGRNPRQNNKNKKKLWQQQY